MGVVLKKNLGYKNKIKFYEAHLVKLVDTIDLKSVPIKGIGSNPIMGKLVENFISNY